jgi:hypothetical protein
MKIGIASTAERRDHISFLIARAAEGEDAAFFELYALTNRKMRKTACAVYPRRAEGRGHSSGCLFQNLAERAELQSGSILSY